MIVPSSGRMLNVDVRFLSIIFTYAEIGNMARAIFLFFGLIISPSPNQNAEIDNKELEVLLLISIM